MHEAAQEIKSKIDIVDFLSKFITLQKAGRNYKALCPFHQEKTPSFMVSPDRQNWRCFGACQIGGDVISFLMKWENCTFYEALQELAKLTGVTLANFEIEDETYKRKDKLGTINREAVKAFTYYLRHPKIGERARSYLSSRKLNNKIIETFAIGFAPPTKRALVAHLLKKGYGQKELIEVGLAIKTYSGEVVDRFHNRLMFPIYDPRGIVLGFSGRTLDTSDLKQAKYINSPETELYKKRETLFGIHLTKKNIQDRDCAVIVEGEFDMISCFEHGITNVVAIKGSALTEQQLTLLSRYTKTITLALDADASGLSTTKRVIPETEKLEFKVQIARLEEGKDPDEALQKDPTKFKKAIEKPIPVYDFVIDYALQKYSLSDPYQKASLITEVAPFIERIENPIVKAHYIRKLSELLEVNTMTIEKGLVGKKVKSQIQSQQTTTSSSNNKEKEFFIASLFFQAPDCYRLYDALFISLKEEIFTIPSINKLLHLFKTFKEKHQQYNVTLFTQTLPAELVDIFDQLYLTDITETKPDMIEKQLRKALFHLRHTQIKEQIKKLITHKQKNDKQNSQIQSLTKELSEIEKSLSLM